MCEDCGNFAPFTSFQALFIASLFKMFLNERWHCTFSSAAHKHCRTESSIASHLHIRTFSNSSKVFPELAWKWGSEWEFLQLPRFSRGESHGNLAHSVEFIWTQIDVSVFLFCFSPLGWSVSVESVEACWRWVLMNTPNVRRFKALN